MTTYIAVIKKGQDRNSFMADMVSSGVQFEEVKGLPRHFILNSNFDHPSIEIIEEDQEVKSTFQEITLNSNLSSGTWALPRIIRRDPPWNKNRLVTPITTFFDALRDGTGVDTYVFDSGVRADHDEFSGGQVTNVYEYYSTGGAGYDYGHGTWVSGCLLGQTLGIARGALCFSFKVMDNTGTGTTTSFIAGVGEAITHYNGRSGLDRPAVACISLRFTSSAISSAVDDMLDAGIVVVASAANDKSDLSTISVFPGEIDDVICVGGLAMNDTPYYLNEFGTNWGSRVDIMSPSQNLRLADVATSSAYLSGGQGTSFGAPYVAGVVACMLQGYSRLTTRAEVQAVKTKLLANASTGKLVNPAGYGFTTLPDRILYLDPNSAFEVIDLPDPPTEQLTEAATEQPTEAATEQPTEANDPYYVGSSTVTYITGTNQDATPDGASQVGDLLVATVFHRGILTPPSGWTLQDSQSGTSGATNRYSVYTKTAEVGDLSASNWAQDVSNRMAVMISTFRKDVGTPSIVDVAGSSQSDTVTNQIPGEQVTATSGVQIAVIGGVSSLAEVSGDTTITPNAAWTLISPATVEANRLAVAIESVSSGNSSTAGSFTGSYSAANNSTASVSVMVG